MSYAGRFTLYQPVYILGADLAGSGRCSIRFIQFYTSGSDAGAAQVCLVVHFVRMWNYLLVSKSLINTAYYTFFGVPLQLMVAFGLALMS